MRQFMNLSIVFLAVIYLSFLSLSPMAAEAAPSRLVVVAPSLQSAKPANKLVAEEEQESRDSEEEAGTASESAAEESTASKSDDKPDDEASAQDSTDDKAKDESAKDQQASKESGKSKKKPEKKAKPYKVKREKLKIEVKLDGYFVADEMHEVALRPEVWSSFKVLEAVEHGTPVKKGDVLVRFDDEKLEEDIEKGTLDQLISELSLLQEEEEFPRLKRLMEISYENAKRNNEQTKADYKYYHETDRPNAVKIAKFRLKSAEQQLDSAREELDQLQKMYEADELTEETEEIVLRRQKFAVESAELSFKLSQENSEYTLNVSLPRSDESYERALEQAELAYQQAKTAKDVGMTRKNYDMEKKRSTRTLSVERHGKLLADKSLMILRAPVAGVAYYGQCTNGKWSQVSALQAKLKPHGKVTANTVLMTVVEPDGLHVESSLSEKDLPDFKTGLNATIVPEAGRRTRAFRQNQQARFGPRGKQQVPSEARVR